MMVLSQPILVKQKAKMLSMIAVHKNLFYLDKEYRLLQGPEKLIIKAASNITFFGQSSYTLGEKSIHLIEADERKDMEIGYDIVIKAQEIISCKTEIHTTYVVAKSNTKAGFAYIRTNINNLKLI